jgi:hypothetical protein
MRLRHDCGRNLADVEYLEYNPDWTADRLNVSARPNVDMDSFRAWHQANRAYIPLAERVGDQEDWHARTYAWRCKCGAPAISRRHERISELWRQHADRREALVVVLLADDL